VQNVAYLVFVYAYFWNLHTPLSPAGFPWGFLAHRPLHVPLPIANSWLPPCMRMWLFYYISYLQFVFDVVFTFTDVTCNCFCVFQLACQSNTNYNCLVDVLETSLLCYEYMTYLSDFIVLQCQHQILDMSIWNPRRGFDVALRIVRYMKIFDNNTQNIWALFVSHCHVVCLFCFTYFWYHVFGE